MAGGAEDDTYTWDLDAPRRADVADLGGADLEDKPGSPPQKGAEIYAGQINEHGRQLEGLNRVTPSARLWVEWTGAAWNVVGVDAMATSDKLDISSFTPASGGAGTLTITWAAGTLPAMARKPKAWCTDDAGFAFGAVTGANAIEVTISDATDTPADLNVAVEIF